MLKNLKTETLQGPNACMRPSPASENVHIYGLILGGDLSETANVKRSAGKVMSLCCAGTEFRFLAAH